MTGATINLLAHIIGYGITLLPFIIITILIVKAVKRSSQRNYELARYKAETERIKAEAMRDRGNKGE